MTLSANTFTRDQVRDILRANLTYRDIQPNDIRALEGFLCIEYARHDRQNPRPEIEPLHMHPVYRKQFEPRIMQSEAGGIDEAYLRVAGRYWPEREAVSFNADGFIGIAGWADDQNVQPFCRALLLWLKEWMGCTRGVPRTVVSPVLAHITAQVAAPAC